MTLIFENWNWREKRERETPGFINRRYFTTISFHLNAPTFAPPLEHSRRPSRQVVLSLPPLPFQFPFHRCLWHATCSISPPPLPPYTSTFFLDNYSHCRWWSQITRLIPAAFSKSNPNQLHNRQLKNFFHLSCGVASCNPNRNCPKTQWTCTPNKNKSTTVCNAAAPERNTNSCRPFLPQTKLIWLFCFSRFTNLQYIVKTGRVQLPHNHQIRPEIQSNQSTA